MNVFEDYIFIIIIARKKRKIVAMRKEIKNSKEVWNRKKIQAI